MSASNDNGKRSGKSWFSTLSPEKLHELCSMGGKAAHALGRAHRFTSETAREAGRKGGLSHTSEHMSRISRLGVAKRAAERAASQQQDEAV